MSRFTKTSTNNNRHPYYRPFFYSDPSHQFWRYGGYSQAYQDFANGLVAQFESENKTVLNLMDNIK